ncbi:hypothetical protein [Pseudooctadecabacter sp.]
MTTLRLLALVSITALSACSMNALDGDSDEGVILITHTGPGTVYWQ